MLNCSKAGSHGKPKQATTQGKEQMDAITLHQHNAIVFDLRLFFSND